VLEKQDDEAIFPFVWSLFKKSDSGEIDQFLVELELLKQALPSLANSNL